MLASIWFRLGRTAVTGEIHYVDGGANINGMIAMDKAGELGELLTDTAAKKG